jgi:cysteine sulfinate desulfinase/cysteine desulfurase-like protein
MPVEEAGKIAKENDLLYCINSAQSLGSINVDVKKLNMISWLSRVLNGFVIH